jgi:hypothetical protein
MQITDDDLKVGPLLKCSLYLPYLRTAGQGKYIEATFVQFTKSHYKVLG